jgi:flagellar biosynthesis GTPase FlhF
MAAYDDLNAKRIFTVGILSIVVTAVTALAVQVVYYSLVSWHEVDLAEKSSYRRQNKVLADQSEQISQYGIDADTGNVTIPVSKAMQLIAADNSDEKIAADKAAAAEAAQAEAARQRAAEEAAMKEKAAAEKKAADEKAAAMKAEQEKKAAAEMKKKAEEEKAAKEKAEKEKKEAAEKEAEKKSDEKKGDDSNTEDNKEEEKDDA